MIIQRQLRPQRTHLRLTMNTLFTVTGLIALFVAAGPVQADMVIRFRDTFSRTATSDLNASDAGQSGDVAPADWVERSWNGDAAIDSSSRLVLSADNTNGSSGAIVYPDYNFLAARDPASPGDPMSLKVTMRVLNGSSAGEGRIMGFGIGQSKAELDALPGSSSSVADVFVGYDTIGSTTGIQVREGGNVETFVSGITGYARTLSAILTFADMNQGTTVDYNVFKNEGELVYSGSTTWSGTNENYINFQSNYSNYSWTSYVQVESTVPEPTTAMLMVMAMAGFGLMRRKKLRP